MHPVWLRFTPSRLRFVPSLALAVLTTLASGCGRAPSPAAAPAPGPANPALAPAAGPPREAVAAQFNHALAGFEEAGTGPDTLLGFQAFAFGSTGIYEVRAKVRMRVATDTFRETPAKAEFVRAGLLPAAQAENYSGDESADYDPRLEATTKDAVFLTPVRRAGETLEVYGTMEARQFVDRWEFSEFSPKGFDLYSLGRPRASFPPAALVQGSPEAERLFADARATREARLSRLRELAEHARALVAPGRRYVGRSDYDNLGSGPAEVVFEVALAPAPAEASARPAPSDGAARTPGECPVALTVTTVWREALKGPPSARRLVGTLSWRAGGYENATKEVNPEFGYLHPADRRDTLLDAYPTHAAFEKGELALWNFPWRLRARPVEGAGAARAR